MQQKIPEKLLLDYYYQNKPYVAQIILSTKQLYSIFILAILFLVLLFMNIFFYHTFLFIDEIIVFMCILFIILMNLPTIHRFFSIINKDEPEIININNDTLSNLLQSNNLPIYSILVPLFKEKDIVKQIISHLSRIEYPKDKLEIFLLLEKDDNETKSALPDNLPEYFSIIEIPAGFPRGKPRALNYGLLQANGEFLTIYDAEDIPDPKQLLKAVAIFKSADINVWAVQAKLRFNNPKSNWLSLLFYCEYKYWYDRYLPYLSNKKYPIPLGGTSNHFRTYKLKSLSGWDSFNVTEDADLALRIYYEGGKILLMDSITYERAPITISNWIRQRTRWVKGLIQTLLVHTRRKQDLPTMKYFLFCISGTLLPFYIIILFIFAISSSSTVYNKLIISIQIWAFMFNITLTAIIYISELKKVNVCLGSILFFPCILFYWFLYLAACFRAIVQFFICPFFWDKTDHRINS